MNSQRYARICEMLARRQPDLTVCMEQVHKPQNVSAVIRTADAIGVHEVHAIWPGSRMRTMASAAPVPANASNHGHLPIKGADGVLITFAKCCRPIPGDPIIAHVSPGKGLVIHHESCRNIRGYQKEPEKFMAVEWDKETAQEFIAEIKVDMFNHQGALAHLTAAINTASSNIQSLNTEEKDGRVYSAFIRLTARDRVHLANIMRKIRVMPDVIKVTRNRN